MHINPDHFLDTEHGRVVTSERNRIAWQECFAALARELDRQGPESKVYILIGPQGAGKSTWAHSFSTENPTSIIFDAILVKRTERAPILKAIAEHAGTAIAVWFKTSLDACISRNASRQPDHIVAERAIRNVYAAIEAPTLDEGFSEILTMF